MVPLYYMYIPTVYPAIGQLPINDIKGEVTILHTRNLELTSLDWGIYSLLLTLVIVQ